eukprot:3990139-Pyramimonas_sp.AAC.1
MRCRESLFSWISPVSLPEPPWSGSFWLASVAVATDPARGPDGHFIGRAWSGKSLTDART